VNGENNIVVVEHPLLIEIGQTDAYEDLVVVVADEDVRLERLAARGVQADDARARMRAQATDEERRAAATHVVVNDGTMDDLTRDVEALWVELTR
jgi:dephospho-CoA kinase